VYACAFARQVQGIPLQYCLQRKWNLELRIDLLFFLFLFLLEQVHLVFILIPKHNLVHQPVDFASFLTYARCQKKTFSTMLVIFRVVVFQFVSGGGSSIWKDANGDTPDYLTLQVVGDELHFHFLVGTQLI
jgi:hypothetical protein